MDELNKITYILIFSHFSIFLVVFSTEDDRTRVFSFFVVVTGFCVAVSILSFFKKVRSKILTFFEIED